MSVENQIPRFKNTIHLWEFLLELLNNERYVSIIAWTRKENGEFKLKKQEEVARQWGLLKQRKGMNYDKLSRSLRYYYDKRIIKKVSGQRLVYRFLELPFQYLPLRNMDEKTRRQQLQSSSVMIATSQPSPSSSSSPAKTRRQEVQSSPLMIPTSQPSPLSGSSLVKTRRQQMQSSSVMIPSSQPSPLSSSSPVKTRRQEVQSSPLMIPTSQPPTLLGSFSVKTEGNSGRKPEAPVICQGKANQTQSAGTRDIMTLNFPPRVISQSQIIFPSCGCIMMGTRVVKPW